ncbi:MULTISPECIES: 50S ribosomal protein L11 methyltransferase [Pseudanabaena]|uniref:Ribosomal L11 methyltransferase n=2 Tax=Pseudanabaena TaxID=1152 RepID=L8MWW3_9CYAN|nr:MULTISPECIES: 50S ribosomal protein L11 methyltransferase [Pseudanabaena]ELS30960.1 ribosomal L11 methyltransferase [Pseudanabaena biceps PCC 7429]MDG3496773.1 50S ribosomal protein L11 methyltransferase [Pseudanabaena catenata USMAC16]
MQCDRSCDNIIEKIDICDGSMAWIELTLDTTNEGLDWVCTLLANAIAAENLHIYESSDRSKKWTFTIQMYLLEDAQIHQRIDAIVDLLKPLHRTGMTDELQIFIVEQRPTKEESFPNLANSLIRRIGDRFVVLAADSTYQVSNPQEIVLRLQNSLAFGSGLHPATILSLRLLERHVNPSLYALDLGSGSGILSVAIAKLGAKAIAIDNDPVAVAATQDALQRNHVTDQVTAMCASIGSASQLGHWMGGHAVAVPAISSDQKFDLIVANIFARVHISLADEFYKTLRSTPDHEGILITAGYTGDRLEDVTNAMVAAGFSLGDREQIDEWIGLSFRKTCTTSDLGSPASNCK